MRKQQVRVRLTDETIVVLEHRFFKWTAEKWGFNYSDSGLLDNQVRDSYFTTIHAPRGTLVLPDSHVREGDYHA